MSRRERHIIMGKQEGRKWHFGWNEFLQRLKGPIKWHFLGHSAGLNSKYLHVMEEIRFENNEIQGKSEHKINFPANWRKCNLRPFLHSTDDICKRRRWRWKQHTFFLSCRIINYLCVSCHWVITQMMRKVHKHN